MVAKIIHNKFINFFKIILTINLFLVLVGSIIFLAGVKANVSETKETYPCIVANSCQTGEFDSIIQKIVVDYYDDVGSKYRWTHKVHPHEALTDCVAAIRAHFPYEYTACVSPMSKQLSEKF